MGNTRGAELQQMPNAESQSINQNKFSTDMATKEKRLHLKDTANIILIAIIALTTGCGQNDSGRQESDIESTKRQNNSLQNCAGSNSQQAAQRTVSIVPQFSASRIQADYWPLLTELGKQTNICFQLKQQGSIPLFEEELKTGSIDYAFMNPYHQVMVKKTYLPILRDEQKLLKGIIVTNKESNITSPKQLHGKTLLLPAPNAFAASLLTRSYLGRKNITFKEKYVKTHQNVYRGVARNSDYIGGGVNNTFNRENNELKSQLTILFETKGYPAHPFSAHNKLPLEEVKNIQNTWLEFASDPKMSHLFDPIQIKKPIKADYDRDYAQLANLDIQKYVQ